MKKITIRVFLYTLIGILIFNGCSKEPIDNTTQEKDEYFITEQLARSLLSRDLNSKEKLSSSGSIMNNKSIREIFPVQDELSKTVYYIINYSGGGFVILSADSRSIPILAYSTEESFETKTSSYPSGLVDWLTENKEQIKYIRSTKSIQSPILKKLWDNIQLPTISKAEKIKPLYEGEGEDPYCPPPYEQHGPLLITKWGQRCGYNDYMPAVGSCSTTPCYVNTNAFAGCVPVAIAQIMYYHQYPKKYSWFAMSLYTGTPETASLIRDIYDFIPTSKKSFDCNGTGVNRNYNSAGVFIGKGYSSAIKADYKIQTVANEISAGRPVILSGGRYSGWWIFKSYQDGHMWVSDGYSKYTSWLGNDDEGGCKGVGIITEMLHMNWGWSRNSNGWYRKSNFNPNGDTFNDGNKMIYQITP